ncbi:Granulins Proepithelin [Collichthys lucidus]|uniref:Granulins Proepithelin n=1 Tax=Collichthys lucidus TaxID=240159 RepID=A0A4U5VT20_COLLU|nr:Granulins Proepithelin [Collichthys lucidus]
MVLSVDRGEASAHVLEISAAPPPSSAAVVALAPPGGQDVQRAAAAACKQMQRWVVICWALLALVGADECPDGGRCEEGQTCCNNPDSGYECCPFDKAECCEDHMHCCPAETICDVATSSCVNATVSIPWVDRASADKPTLSKSFRMIRAYKGEDEENVCPDNSRCPPEYSCLKALTKYGCCPLAQFVTSILCSDGVSECPEGTTCCEDAEGKWGCCPMPKAVCCEDKTHCCPEGTTCDTEHSKCISTTTRKEMPMWAKLPARIRAEWEDHKLAEQVTAKTANEGDEKTPEVTTVNSVPPTEKEVTVSSVARAAAGDVPCNDTSACPDNTTCCKTDKGEWSCCPLPEATCCEDHIHCCPHGKKCNLAAQTCDDEKCSVPWVAKIPVMLRVSVKVEDVPCDSTASCPDGTTCCKNKSGLWACCPLPKAVCCDDHEHCCPSGTTCDPTSTSCEGSSGSVPMLRKIPAFTTVATTTQATSTQTTKAASTEQTEDADEDEAMPDEDEAMPDEDEVMTVEEESKEVEGKIECDHHTSCPRSSTCCFMSSSQKWGCCPLPKAVCCADGNHCCPSDYRCDESKTSCTKGEVVIPWYTKLPATTGVQAEPNSMQCDGQTQCPDHTTCCKLVTGQWGCCPLENAVCCPDKEHCCPQGYTCNIASNCCQKVIMLQLESLPLTPVFLPEHHPEPSVSEVKCDDQTSCEDGETCCRTSATTWGCCPYPNAVCCSDMLHCCPTGYTCTGAGDCTQDPRLHWLNWRIFYANKKRALIV